MIGKFCIARCSSAGVHAGTVESVEGSDVAVLANARRLWYWKTNKGHSLNAVAQHGLNYRESKIPTAVPLIRLSGVCELIVCTPEAEKSIMECPEHNV